jgi:hypothetical protein
MPSALRLTRKRALVAAGLLLVLVVAAVLLFNRQDTSTGYGDIAPKASGPPPRPRVHPFGEAVLLKTSRTTIEVRPTAFSRQPATAAASPSIGVELNVRNVGRDRYLDQPSQAASVVLRDGGEADRTYDPVGRCGGSPDTVRMAPGQSARWCIAFEATGRPNIFIYAPEVGLPNYRGAPEAAAWSLGRRAGAGR